MKPTDALLQDYAMQAITTRYFGPTNHRGSRVKATANAGSVTISWDHALNSLDNHAAAALALAAKYGWTKQVKLVAGAMPNESGYVFVAVRS